MQLALFFFFFFAILTFLTPIPSFAIFFIIMFFFSTAYILYLLGASFLAMIVLIVYVGAIAMLFVFCVILFERTPIYSNYFFYRSVLICFSFLGIFYFFSDFFLSHLNFSHCLRYTQFFKGKKKLLLENATSTYSSPFDFSFFDSFSSFFFITDQGLIYIVLIGFFLFFFTLGVTYIFYFTKK